MAGILHELARLAMLRSSLLKTDGGRRLSKSTQKLVCHSTVARLDAGLSSASVCQFSRPCF